MQHNTVDRVFFLVKIKKIKIKKLRQFLKDRIQLDTDQRGSFFFFRLITFKAQDKKAGETNKNQLKAPDSCAPSSYNLLHFFFFLEPAPPSLSFHHFFLVNPISFSMISYPFSLVYPYFLLLDRVVTIPSTQYQSKIIAIKHITMVKQK